MPSSAISAMAANPNSRFFVSSFPIRYMAGSIKTPASAPGKRQAKGVMPSFRIEKAMNTLPSGGCDIS